MVVGAVEKYRATVEVDPDGAIRLYFGVVGAVIPNYKYLERVRNRILQAIEVARRLGCLEEAEE